MSSSDTPLSAEQIELINAYGPYNHALWTASGIEITNEEKLSGRGAFLVERIRQSLLEQFTPDEIRALSILDVGCYDGWILDQLSDLPFRRMVGVEPREKNITKGRRIREILGLETRVEFLVGDIDTLGPEVFDIVICVGVLHHLESIPAALRGLKAVCGKFIFIETVCLSSKHITKAVREEIEMKDVIYRSRPRTCGLTGQKLESAYYDGSASELSVVSIPSVESLVMYMDTIGFEDVRVVADPESYRASVWKDARPMNAVCAVARVGPQSAQVDESLLVRDYEGGLLRTNLEMRLVGPLYATYCERGVRASWTPLSLLVLAYVLAPNWLCALPGTLIDTLVDDAHELEILRNMRFNPADKVRLEYAKILYQQGDLDEARTMLRTITQGLNADWRCVYRSFYLLSCICRDLGLTAESERYREFCLTSNPKFPRPLFSVPGQPDLRD